MNEAWDDGAWRALADELDAWKRIGRGATFWWRDDDAGRSDPALERLLALAVDLGAPMGLAVVPAWLAPEVAQAIRGAPERVAVLQHGFRHANHETEIAPGERKVRPAEYGAARPPGVVLEEAVEGDRILQAAFGPRHLSVFVPPWNRIAAAVVAGLPAVGYRALSTFRPRPAVEAAPGLRQVNCHADPILWRQGGRFAGAAATLESLRVHLAARRQAQADPTEATGLLTHHRVLDAACWEFLGELFPRLQSHPAVEFPSLPALFPERISLSGT
jgi:hypothetical protein